MLEISATVICDSGSPFRND